MPELVIFQTQGYKHLQRCECSTMVCKIPLLSMVCNCCIFVKALRFWYKWPNCKR